MLNCTPGQVRGRRRRRGGGRGGEEARRLPLTLQVLIGQRIATSQRLTLRIDLTELLKEVLVRLFVRGLRRGLRRPLTLTVAGHGLGDADDAGRVERGLLDELGVLALDRGRETLPSIVHHV